MTGTDRQPQGVTPVVENYLKTIYALGREDNQVKTTALAERVGVQPSSVTAMLKTLSELGLARYTPYHGVELTPAGEKVALEVIRHHRLVELYLVEALGYGWDEVHEEAEQLEHVISEKLEARMAARLGQPTVDPHGDPIPALDGSVEVGATVSLADTDIGVAVRVARVIDQDAGRLRYISGLGLVPGADVEVTAKAPFDGPISVLLGDTVHVLDRRLARMILVER